MSNYRGMTSAEYSALREEAIRIGVDLAKRFFETRGNNSEVHIGKERLGALIALGIETYEANKFA